MNSSRYLNFESFTRKVGQLALERGGGDQVTATTILPKALLQADGVGFEVTASKGLENPASKVLLVKDWRLTYVIRVDKHEREAKQLVATNLKIHDMAEVGESDYQASLKAIQLVCALRKHSRHLARTNAPPESTFAKIANFPGDVPPTSIQGIIEAFQDF